MRSSAWITATVAMCACSDGPPTNVELVDGRVGDALDERPPSCWPEIARMPDGTVTLGGSNTDGSFMDMPETTPIAYGPQAGYMVFVHAKMSGISAGNPMDILDASNPFTRIRAYFADTGIPLLTAECGFRFAYKESVGGGYEMHYAMPIVFEVCWRFDNLVGARIRVDLELMDSEGHFASDSKVVTGGRPLGTPGNEYPDEEGMGGGCTQNVARPAPPEIRSGS